MEDPNYFPQFPIWFCLGGHETNHSSNRKNQQIIRSYAPGQACIHHESSSKNYVPNSIHWLISILSQFQLPQIDGSP